MNFHLLEADAIPTNQSYFRYATYHQPLECIQVLSIIRQYFLLAKLLGAFLTF
jgi:hypothetical protein